MPARFVFLLDFAIAALAAYGFDTLLHPLPRRLRADWRRVFPALAFLLAGVVFLFIPLMFVAVNLNQSQDIHIFNRTANGFNGLVLFAMLLGGSLVLLLARRTRWLSKRMWAVAIVAFVFFDLASLGAYLDTGDTDPTANFRHPAAFAWLDQAQPFRIETPDEDWSRGWSAWQPNLGLVAHLDDAAGIYNPLLLQRYDRYWKAAAGRDSVLYDLLNTQYLVTTKAARPPAKFTLAFDRDPVVNIWQNQRALPRAFVVYRSRVVASGDEAFSAITALDFDPSRTVVLEGGQALAGAAPASDTVQVTARTTNSVILNVTTDADGYLVVGDTYYPGWRAMIDGADAPLLRADYLFQAVRVPAGAHQVKLIFDPLSWKLGVTLTAFGLALLAIFWLRDRRSGHIQEE